MAIKSIRTKPYTPQTNGIAERFIKTLLNEWALAMQPLVMPGRDMDQGCLLKPAVQGLRSSRPIASKSAVLRVAS